MPNAPPSVVVRRKWLIVGGGLHGCLLALSLLDRNPEIQLTLVEPAPTLGGNHTWCFYEGDIALPPAWLRSIVVRTWPAYAVRFADYERRLEEPYFLANSERLHSVLEGMLKRAPNACWLRGAATSVEPGRVCLADGQTLEAEHVADARGPSPMSSGGGGVPEAYQKFVGLELRVGPAGVPSVPTVMDGRVAQHDGFRFVYVLPLNDDRVLVEDTYFSDSAELEEATLVERSLAYARGLGLVILGIERQEQGVLRLPLRLRTLSQAADAEGPGLIRIGYAGGLFHPTTGYSLPWAVLAASRLADLPASTEETSPGGQDTRRREVARAMRTLRADLARQQGYAVWLNRLLFEGFGPDKRHHVLARFYRLPEETIRHFYALTLKPRDRLRIIVGWPPRGLSMGRLARRAVGA